MAKKFCEPIDKELLTNLYLQNYSYKYISEKLNGLSPYLIKKFVTQLGLPKRNTQDVIKKSNLDKLGVEYPFQKKSVQQKVKDTFKNKYNVENPSQLSDWKEKREKTCLQKFGTINNSCTKDWKIKHEKTCLTKYGEINNSCLPEWKEQVVSTNNRLYKSDWYSQTPEYLQRKIETCLSKYGCIDYNQKHIKHLDEWIQFDSWVDKYLEKNNIITPKIVKDYFQVSLPCALDTIRKYNLENKFFIQQYQLEYYLEQIILEVTNNYKKHDRTIIKPQELDFLLIDKALAIEVNDIASHHLKDNLYHLNKFIQCQSKNITLIQIFEHEFYHYDIKNWLLKVLNLPIPIELVDFCIKPIEKVDLKFLWESNSNYLFSLTTNAKWTEGTWFEVIYNDICLLIFNVNCNLNTCQIQTLIFNSNYLFLDVQNKIFQYLCSYFEIREILYIEDNSRNLISLIPTLNFKETEYMNPKFVYVNNSFDLYIPDEIIEDTNTNFPRYKNGYIKQYDCGYTKYIWRL